MGGWVGWFTLAGHVFVDGELVGRELVESLLTEPLGDGGEGGVGVGKGRRTRGEENVPGGIVESVSGWVGG